MEFTITFLKVFMTLIYLVSPILGFLMLVITLIGQVIGRIEHWSKIDSLYFAFITATTVGYGDFRPVHRRTKIASIFITLVGILMTGIIVAVGIKSIEIAFTNLYDIEVIKEHVSEKLKQ